MERRTLMAVVSWAVDTSGDWGVAANWLDDQGVHRLPAAGDDVVIDRPSADPTVTLGSGSVSIRSLATQEPFVLSGATLTVTGSVTAGSTFTLGGGGTLAKATVPAGTTIKVATSGNLNGVTLDGDLDLSSGGSGTRSVTVTGGLTLDGVARLGAPDGSSGGRLEFRGAQALDGTGSVLFGAGGNGLFFNGNQPGDALTIGPGVTIHGGSGAVGFPAVGNTSYGLVVEGAVVADVPGGTISVRGGPLSNAGTLAADGGTLNITAVGSASGIGVLKATHGGTLATQLIAVTQADSLLVDGLVSADAGSTINLGGVVTLGDNHHFATAAGNLVLSGTLRNSGKTLVLVADSGPLQLRGGTIQGGRVTASGGASLKSLSGTLDGVVLDADLDLSSGPTGSTAGVVVIGGLTLDGVARLGTSDGSSGGRLEFRGAQALDGTGSVLFGARGSGLYFNGNQPGDALTIGPGITIHGRSGVVGFPAVGNTSYGLVVQGTVLAEVPGATISVRGGPLTNTGTLAADGGTLNASVVGAGSSIAGTLAATHGGTLGIQDGGAGAWALSGLVSADAGSRVSLGGTLTLGPGDHFATAAGTLTLTGTLDNAGKTLTLDAGSTGSLHVSDGTIRGGTVTASNGTVLYAGGSSSIGARLDGVRLDGDLSVLGTMTVTNGLTLNGTATIGLEKGPQSVYGVMIFSGNQTFDGSGTVQFDGTGSYQVGVLGFGLSRPNVLGIGGPLDTLTIGPGIVVTANAGGAGSLGREAIHDDLFGDVGFYGSLGTLVNLGTIRGGTPGRIRVNTAQFTNEGTIASITANTPGTNRGAIELPEGSGVTLNGAWTFEAGTRITGPGTLDLGGVGTSDAPAFFEARSADLGLTTAGFATDTLFGTLRLTASHLLLVDLDDDSPGAGREAIYVNRLEVESGSSLDLNNLKLYARQLDSHGSIVGGTIDQLPDLQTTAVTAPAAGVAGRAVTVTWTVANRTNQTVGGSWQDAVYLSTDPVPDAADRLLAVVPRSGPLAPNGTYTASLTLDLPGVVPGSYYVIVDADRRGQVDNGQYVTNNARASAGAMVVDVPELVPGTPASGAFDRIGASRFYRLVVPEGGPTLALALDAQSAQGSNELDVRRGAMPEPGVADFRATSVRPDQELVAGDLGPGVYYIEVAHQSGPAADAFTLTASLPSLSIQGLDRSSGANAGRVTVGLTGTRFTPDTRVSLVAADGRVVPTSSLQYADPTRVFATFDLTGVATGAYDVRVDQGSSSAVLPRGFSVTAGPAGHIEVFLSVPSFARYVFSPSAEAQITLRYVNTGETDAVAPLFLISAGGGDLRWPGESTYSPDIQALGINRDGPAGILPPGAEGTLVLSLRTSGTRVDVEVREASDPSVPVDWSALRDSSRPDTVDADAWSAIWGNFASSAGATVGQYQAMLADNATRLAQLGETTADVRRLIGFELLQADDSLPVRSLAGGVDAAFPTPGLGLAFGRQFLQPLEGRYRLGILGRGWTYTGDLQLVANSEGDVSILSGGAARLFRNLGGTFVGGPGDHGVLTLAGGVYSLREMDGTVTSFRADGRIDSTADRNGNSIHFEYNGGLLTALVHSSGSRITLAYDGRGRLASVTDPAGRVTTYEYDATGEYLLSVTDASGTTSYTYETGGTPQQRYALKSVMASGGAQVTFDYDLSGRLVRRADVGRAEGVTFSYDSAGGIETRVAGGSRTTTLYTDTGQVGLVRDALGREQRYSYDGRGNLIAVQAPLGTSFSYGYDDRDNLVRITDPAGGVIRMTYGPAFNQLLTLRDRRGNTTIYQYESDGDLAAIVYPDGSKEQFAYDPLGNLVLSENRRDQPIRYTVDDRGLVTRKDYADGTAITYTYDERANLRTAVDAHGTTTLEYDADRLSEITYPGGRFLAFTYDAAGRRQRSVDQDGFTVNYAYDPAGRLDELTDAAGNRIVKYTYDPVGRLSRKDMGNGTLTTYAYDDAGQLISLVNHAPDASVNSRFDYTYDALGRRKSMTTLDGTTTYGYDAKGQLTSAVLPGGRTINYEYDPEGNRTAVTDNGVRTPYLTNVLNQYAQVGSEVFTYDIGGNLTKVEGPGGTTTFAYDIENRLVGMTRPGETWTAEYDALGNRVATTEGSRRTSYLFDPAGFGSLVAEYGDNSQATSRYVQGVGLVSYSDASGAAYYDFDGTGNTVGLSGESGGYINAYKYDPFGREIGISEAIHNIFRFSGEFGAQSDEFGNVQMGARPYLPSLGRFLTPDPTGLSGGTNQYTYVVNSPVLHADPLGTDLASDLQAWKQIVATVAYSAYWSQVPFSPPPPPSLVQAFGVAARQAMLEILASGESTLNLPQAARLLQFAEGVNPFAATGVSTTSEAVIASEPAVVTATASEFAVAAPAVGGGPTVAGVAAAAGTTTLGVGVLLGSYFLTRYAIEHNILRAGDLYNVVYNSQLLDEIANDVAPAVVSIRRIWATLSAVGSGRVITSFDPNDITGPNGIGEQNWLRPEGVLPYTIQFENKATAEAPAQEVFVTQQLDADLDWSTFELGDILFGAGTRVSVPAGLRSYRTSVDVQNLDGSPLRVDIEAGLDLQTGIVTWTFRSVDPATGGFPFDPFAGFLPPDDESGRGEGSVSYTVRARAGLAGGTRLDAQASIVFDVNDPILTPAIFNTLDVSAPSASVQALPATSPASFTVSWAGSDPDESGVASYDVFVSVDGGPFTVWLDGVATTSADYQGQDGKTYAFSAVATDAVGHRQSTPEAAQATTRVLVTAGTTTAVQSSRNPAATGEPVTFTAVVSAGASSRSGTPTGSVQFRVDGAPFGPPVPLVGGVATSSSISSLTPGSHAVAAEYTSDDARFLSGSGTLAGGQVVSQASGRAATSTVVVASLASPVYGQALSFSVTVSPPSGGSTPTGTVQFVLDGVPFGAAVTLVGGVAGSPGVSTLGAGRHTVTAIYSGDASYAPSTSQSLSATVAKARLTVRAADETKVYGRANPALRATYHGFVNGDDPSDLGHPAKLATTATPGSHVGVYSITVAGASSDNYRITFVPGTLRVTPAPLTIAANDRAKVAGAALPELSATYTGFVNGDGPTSLTKPARLRTSATAASPAGTYAITVDSASSRDYSITFRDGVLTVVPRTVLPPPGDPVARARTAIITTLYEELLGRKPEPGGLRYWVQRLAAGMSPGRVALTIWRSTERRGHGQSSGPRARLRLALNDAIRAGLQAATDRATPAGPRQFLQAGRSR